MSDAPEESTPFNIRVLLVDDQLIIGEAVRRMMGDRPDIEFHHVADARLAADAAAKLLPTVILQDLVMPEIDGFALIKAYREMPVLREVPIIVLSAKEDPKLKAHSFAVGANDYLVKLPDKLELLARVRYHSAGHIGRLQRDEAFRMLRESQQNLANANIELQKLAALDGLTGIANRRCFDDAMQSEWRRGQRDQSPLSLVMVDLDAFKAYNDRYGHPAGDMVLKKTAAILTAQLKRPADLAARYGGEEFAILLPDTELAGALDLADACRRHLEGLAIEHGAADGGIVTMSLGVASVVPNKDGTAAALIERADKALYAAKSAGRNRVCAAGPH
jgi:two-component system chemotaxis family response regulator WspR